MADLDRIARIRAYLEQHQDTYDREALRQQLLADGHDSEDIDVAMAQVFDRDDSASVPPTSARTKAVVPLVAIGVVIVNSGACFTSLRTMNGITPIIVGVVLEFIAVAFLLNRQPSIARGIGLGVFIWFILAMALVIFVLLRLGYLGN